MGAGGPISNGTGVLLRRGRDTMSARAQKAARGRGEGRAVHRPSGEVPGAAALPAHPGLPAPEQRGEHSYSLRLPVWGTPLQQPSRPAPECHGRAGKGGDREKARRGPAPAQASPLRGKALSGSQTDTPSAPGPLDTIPDIPGRAEGRAVPREVCREEAAPCPEQV